MRLDSGVLGALVFRGLRRERGGGLRWAGRWVSRKAWSRGLDGGPGRSRTIAGSSWAVLAKAGLGEWPDVGRDEGQVVFQDVFTDVGDKSLCLLFVTCRGAGRSRCAIYSHCGTLPQVRVRSRQRGLADGGQVKVLACCAGVSPAVWRCNAGATAVGPKGLRVPAGRARGGARGAETRARAGSHLLSRARRRRGGEFAAQKPYYTNPAVFFSEVHISRAGSKSQS